MNNFSNIAGGNLKYALQMNDNIKTVKEAVSNAVNVDIKSLLSLLEVQKQNLNNAHDAFETIVVGVAMQPTAQELAELYVDADSSERAPEYAKAYSYIRQYALTNHSDLFDEEKLDRLLKPATKDLKDGDRIERLALEHLYSSQLLLAHIINPLQEMVSAFAHSDKRTHPNKYAIKDKIGMARRAADDYLEAMTELKERLISVLKAEGMPVECDEVDYMTELQKGAEAIKAVLSPAVSRSTATPSR